MENLRTGWDAETTIRNLLFDIFGINYIPATRYRAGWDDAVQGKMDILLITTKSFLTKIYIL